MRTAKQVGGHLPSARVTNTANTSFTHYLRTDPFVTEWAADVLTEAITDAEESARAVVVRLGAGEVAAVPERVREQAAAGELDTLASACTDIENAPGGGRCQQSFLTCFGCPNALVMERHLPALLSLAEALREDLQRQDVGQWTARYGTTWQILTRDILPRFSPAQRAAAQETQPHLMLDLLHGPKEWS
ncbi:hypothetical protein [Streptomyces sp. ME19-01-6]|uniref:hypothetical protein n=1 Tax=Streptomyces sp. ME19-01-6 TaxID=3028686 RepID=UPI0029BD908D|nr:hypothetical protein [Streptomyces sp. ME19-01-6]MDX3230036.1 hypothetical protein [Streptomyces sp. ME19-01-6]